MLSVWETRCFRGCRMRESSDEKKFFGGSDVMEQGVQGQAGQPSNTPLAGKTALVTGSTRGIGRAAALELSRLGANVVINYHGNAEAARDVQTLIEGRGGKAIAVGADVDQSAEIDRLFATIAQTFDNV